jgi:hypothetical protein
MNERFFWVCRGKFLPPLNREWVDRYLAGKTMKKRKKRRRG